MYHIAFEVLVNNLVSSFFRSLIVFQLLLKHVGDVSEEVVTPAVFMWYFRTRGGGRV